MIAERMYLTIKEAVAEEEDKGIMVSLRRCSGSTSSSKEGVEEEEDKGNRISTSARNCWHFNENKFDPKFQFLLKSRMYRYSSVLY